MGNLAQFEAKHLWLDWSGLHQEFGTLFFWSMYHQGQSIPVCQEEWDTRKACQWYTVAQDYQLHLLIV